MCMRGRESTSGVHFDVAGSDFAFALSFDMNGFGSVAVDFRNQSLHVQDNFGHIFFYARYC